MTLTISSEAFDQEGEIPRKHTCDSENLSPPLLWSGVPDDTQSLALIVDDPDAPEGRNDWKRTGYRGPCPPVGRHRYYFKLFALDVLLPDLGRPTKADLEQAMQGHVLADSFLMGTYRRT